MYAMQVPTRTERLAVGTAVSFLPFPDGIPEQARWRALTLAFARCTPMEHGIAERASVPSATAGGTETTVVRRRNGAIERRAPTAAP